MHILIAPNAFKNSLSAIDASNAIYTGLMESKLQCTAERFPIADGGDGTADLIIAKLNGDRATARVHDPLGRIINASFAIVDNDNAVIEMADASGLRLLKPPELDPLHATSLGTGELIKQALDKGVSNITIAMGGSATVDGGTGILKVLGIRFLNSKGEELNDLPESLVHLSEIDTSDLDERVFNCQVTVLCDVDNKLLGPSGAAAVFGPQKGASAAQVTMLEASLAKFAEVTLQQTGKDLSQLKYGGTAGGAAAGLYAFSNAKLVNGIEYFLQLTNFDEALNKTDLLITGEGSLDEQTLQGKGPFGVAHRARKKGIPVIGLAGKVPLRQHSSLHDYFDVLLAIGNEVSNLETAMLNTKDNLIRTALQIGNLLALKQFL